MQLKSMTSDKQANKTTGLGSSRIDIRMHTAKLKSLESLISDKNRQPTFHSTNRKDVNSFDIFSIAN